MGIVVGVAALVAVTMATRMRFPRSAVVPIGKLLGHEAAEADLPCPWCQGPTAEDDLSCPSCGKRFG
jgi:hypothetical protein